LGIEGIESETDHIIVGDAKKYYSQQFLEEQELWVEEYTRDLEPLIERLIDELNSIQT
jgi:hypothetical protein